MTNVLWYIIYKVFIVHKLLPLNMDMTTRVGILHEALYISHSANILWKDVNSIFSPS